VTELQPSLRWQAFSLPEPEGSLSEVTYEVKIWAAAHDTPGQLVYAREGLPEPSHNVQESLPPSMTLFWSVRARFLLNGLPRVIEAKKQKSRAEAGPESSTSTVEILERFQASRFAPAGLLTTSALDLGILQCSSHRSLRSFIK